MRIFVLLIFGFFSSQSLMAQGEELFNYLNGNSKVIKTDTLHVFYFENWNDDFTTSEIVEYEGKSIDSKWIPLLSNHLSVDEKVYLLGKIEIDQSHSAFILRHQSTYSPQKISLLIYDSESLNISSTQLLADSGGDGTWVYNLDGWLINEDSVPRLVNWKTERWEDDETEEWKRSDSVWISIWNGSEFERLENQQLDRSEFTTYYDQIYGSAN